MSHRPPDLPPKPPAAAERPTNRRAEVEQARRSMPVQSLRGQLKTLDSGEASIRRLAEALRGLLRQKDP
jgi:hypothetical protein